MRKITDLEELKKIQLDILLKVHAFCEDEGLRYSLDSGTLLGAIRHKGYIPWDDDIDIIMPRPDYRRFLNEFNGYFPELEVYAPELDWNYYAPYANVCDTRTILKEGRNGHRKTELGIKIDIFPVDGAPADYDEYLLVLKKIDRLNLMLQSKRLSLRPFDYSFRTTASVIYHRLISVFRSYSSIQKEISMICQSFTFDDSAYAAKLSYTSTKNRSPRETFEKYECCDFEGHSLKIIQDYDAFLRKMYGDYMKLPPENERVPHHNFEAYWKN